MEQLTKWGTHLEAMTSQYGLVTFIEWLNREQERLESRKIKCEIRQHPNPKNTGQFALFRTEWVKKEEV